jgi:hypothetical protein
MGRFVMLEFITSIGVIILLMAGIAVGLIIAEEQDKYEEKNKNG